MRSILACLLLCASSAVWAQEPSCGERVGIVERLAGKYQEALAAIGLAYSGALIEIFVSPGGTWTMLVSGADGKSCIVATGTDWQERAVPQDPGA